MNTLHLIYGPQGAGKSTRAGELARIHRALPLAIDDWMGPLFGPDVPRPMDLAWVMDRVQRCESRIWLTAEAALRAGCAVVLDLGFMKRAQREAAAARGIELGKDDARERIYGEPFARWKAKHQPEATPEQLVAFAEAQRRHA